MSRNPAVFDITKLEWMNGVYIRSLAPGDFVDRSLPLVEADLGRALNADERGVFSSVAPLVQERSRRLTEVASQVRFLFAPADMDPASWESVMTTPEARPALEGALAALERLEAWDKEGIEAALRADLTERGLSARKGLQPVRVAVTGSTVSPPLFESLAALGREGTLSRLRAAIGSL